MERIKITDGSVTALALDYTLKRWQALTRYLDDGQLPIDNDWIENQIRPIASRRSDCQHVMTKFWQLHAMRQKI